MFGSIYDLHNDIQALPSAERPRELDVFEVEIAPLLAATPDEEMGIDGNSMPAFHGCMGIIDIFNDRVK